MYDVGMCKECPLLRVDPHSPLHMRVPPEIPVEMGSGLPLIQTGLKGTSPLTKGHFHRGSEQNRPRLKGSGAWNPLSHPPAKDQGDPNGGDETNRPISLVNDASKPPDAS